MEDIIKKVNKTIIEIETYAPMVEWADKEKSMAIVKDKPHKIILTDESLVRISLDEDQIKFIYKKLKEIELRESREEFWD